MNAELPGGLVALDPIANPEAVAMGEFLNRLHQHDKAKAQQKTESLRWWVWLLAGGSALNTLLLAALLLGWR